MTDIVQSRIETISRIQTLCLDQIHVVLDAFMARKQSPIKSKYLLTKKLNVSQVPTVTETQIYVKKSMHHNGRPLWFSFFMTILDY